MTAAPHATFRDALAQREFRALWLADAQSALGDQLSRIALAVLVFRQSHSTTLTALTYAVTFLPALFGGALLGGLADRVPHRTTLIAGNVVRAGLVAGMAVPGTPLAALFVLVFASTAVSAPFDSANSAMLSDVLEGELYPVGSAARTVSHQVAQLIGFAGGGFLLTALSPRLGLLLDAATFVVAAVIVRAAVRLRPTPAGDEPERYWRSVRAGVRTVRDTPTLRILLGLSSLMGLLVVPEGLAVPYAARLGAGSVGAGLLLAAGPAGLALGSTLFVKLLPDSTRTALIGTLAALGGLPLLACAVHPGLVVSAVLWASSGVCGAYLAQLMPQYVRAAPSARRGQAIGVAAAGLMGAQGLGVLLGGVLAGATNPALAVSVAGLVVIVLGAAADRQWRRLLGSRVERGMDESPLTTAAVA